MSIRRTKQISPAEKRFKQLQQQIYGKQREINSNQVVSTPPRSNYSFDSSTPSIPVSKTTSDSTYLKHDLLKIVILSTLAIGTELVIYFLNQNHYLNLNFLKF